MTTESKAKASHIRLLIVDIDGVMTDGGLQFDNRGEEYKTFNSLDGHGIRMLLDSGIDVAVITGRKSEIVNHRMGDLGLKYIYQGHRNKLPAFEQLLADTGHSAGQVAYVGDDLPDLPVMRRVGLSVAVQNAHPFVKQHCDLLTNACGGKGAVREVTDLILDSQSLLDPMQRAYLE